MSDSQPPLRAVPMALFPTFGSLQDVVDYADSKLPITSKNEISSLLFTWHNTLLALQTKERDGKAV